MKMRKRKKILMSKRGPCKHCAWLFAGMICLSPNAQRLEVLPSGREKLKPTLHKEVKVVSSFFNKHTNRRETRIEWAGCFNDISNFLRKRRR